MWERLLTDSSTSSSSDVPIRIWVDPHESLPDLLTRVREARGRTVVIDIPDHSPILLTATEFRALKEVTDRAGITLTLETDDRLRMQLAKMLGITSTEPGTLETDGWRPEPTALGSSRAFGTWRSHRKQTDEEKTPAIDISTSATTRRRRRLGETSRGTDAPVDDEVDAPITTGALDYIDDDPGRRARLIGRMVAVVLVIALIGGIAGWYFLPNVTVRATLKQTTVSASFIYVVASEGATVPPDAAFSLAATQGEATVPFTISIPATGVDLLPQETARGSVTLRNPTESEVNVPAGTQLTNHAGIAYTTNEDVTVPAASGDGAGETTVAITAVEAGSQGNQAVGYLTGKIDDLGIYYANRDSAIEGGTDTETTVVSAEDIANVEAAIPANLQRAAAEGWQSTLSDGQAIVPQSVQAGEPTYQVDQEAGTEAETVSLSGTVDVTGLIFTQGEVEAQSLNAATALLTPMLPAGYALRPETITYSEPTVLAESAESVQFQVTATGGAQAVFDEAARSQLANDLKGKDWSAAESQISGIDAFETVDLSRSPGWWFARMPHTADRITVEVDATMQGDGTPEVTAPVADETPEAGS